MRNLLTKTVRTIPFFLLGVILLMTSGFVFAQGNCSSDGTVEFKNDPGGVVTLNPATVRNVTGSNNDDRDIGMNTLSDPDTTSNGSGTIVVDGIEAADFPTTGIRANGFNRRVNRFWRIDYIRGERRFNQRSHLNVDVSFTVSGNEATNGTSAVSLEPRQLRLRPLWYSGSNDLRRLEGDVRFRYRDMQKLAQEGIHNATVEVCVEVSGNT